MKDIVIILPKKNSNFNAKKSTLLPLYFLDFLLMIYHFLIFLFTFLSFKKLVIRRLNPHHFSNFDVRYLLRNMFKALNWFREFSFTLEGDIYLRYLTFTSQAEFETALKKKCPIKIDIGAVYNGRLAFYFVLSLFYFVFFQFI